MNLPLQALPWYLATVFFGLSEAAEVAAITGAFGALSSVIAAYFGYRAMVNTRASRRIEVYEEHGPVVGKPDPELDKELEGKNSDV